MLIQSQTDRLIDHLQQLAKPSTEELDLFLDLLKFAEVPNKAYILKSGQYCRHQHFILQGCFRIFFVNEKGVEKITNFAIENWWLADHDSYGNGIPSQLYIQAIEPSLIISIKQEDLNELLENSLELNKYFRRIWERVRISDQKRIQYMFNLSGKELWEVFREHNPGFVQRVPQYMLASYLGFTPEFLSKVRSIR